MAGHESEKEEMSSRQKAFLAKREELTARLAELDKDMFRIQAQKEKLEEKLEASTAYMWSEYEMTYSTALELKREEYQSVPEVKKLIDELKSRIKGLGNINVNAIEDYKEVSERYEFMRTQHETWSLPRPSWRKSSRNWIPGCGASLKKSSVKSGLNSTRSLRNCSEADGAHWN